MHHLRLLLPLLALGLFFLFPWWLALLLYVPLLIGSLFAYWKALQAQRASPFTGREAMIGDRAVVATTTDNKTAVHYHGETWRAISSHPAHPGQQVIIEGIEGLTLRVRPLRKRMDNGRGGPQR